MIHYLKKIIASRSSNERKVLKNSTWLFVAEIGTRIARGALGIIAARMLGVNGLGQFAYAMALGGFLTFFEDAGIGMFITREFSKDTRDEDQKRIVFSTAFVLKLLLLGIATIIFVITGPFISNIPSANILIPTIALVLIFDSLRELFFSISRAEQRMHTESLVKLITNGLVVFFGIMFMLISPTALSLTLGYVLGGGIGCLIIFNSIKKYLPNIRTSFSKKLFIDIFKTAWPFTILAISNVIIFNTDTLFLGHYSTVTEVGWYTAATRLIQALYIIPSLFASAAFPIFVQKMSRADGYTSSLKKSLFFITVIMIPLLLICIFGSSVIINVLYGTTYAPAAIILAVFSLTFIPVFIGTTLNTTIFAMNQQKQFVLANVLGMLVNIIMDFLLIPHFHSIGAAIATTVSLSLITVITIVKMSRLSKQSNII
jgi:O-antigen/teichoic acid export membrane protein